MKYITLLFLLFLFSCKNDSHSHSHASAEETSASAVLPEGFADFYQKFHSDSLYQVEHIVFPLEGLPDHADSLAIVNEDFRWQAEDWQMQRQFDFEMSEFRRHIVPVNDMMVLERIVHQSGEFGMVRRFALLGGEWHLIYYAGMNRLAK